MPTFQLLSLTTQGGCNRTSMRRIEAQHAICAGGGAPSSPATHRAADHRINNKWHASLNRCLEQLHRAAIDARFPIGSRQNGDVYVSL